VLYLFVGVPVVGGNRGGRDPRLKWGWGVFSAGTTLAGGSRRLRCGVCFATPCLSIDSARSCGPCQYTPGRGSIRVFDSGFIHPLLDPLVIRVEKADFLCVYLTHRFASFPPYVHLSFLSPPPTFPSPAPFPTYSFIFASTLYPFPITLLSFHPSLLTHHSPSTPLPRPPPTPSLLPSFYLYSRLAFFLRLCSPPLFFQILPLFSLPLLTPTAFPPLFTYFFYFPVLSLRLPPLTFLFSLFSFFALFLTYHYLFLFLTLLPPCLSLSVSLYIPLLSFSHFLSPLLPKYSFFHTSSLLIPILLFPLSYSLHLLLPLPFLFSPLLTFT